MRLLARLLARLARGSATHPRATLTVAVLLAAIGLAAASRLELRTSNLDLVDPTLPQVQAFLDFAADFGTPNVLVVALRGTGEGNHESSLRAAIDEIVPRIRQTAGVRSATAGPPVGELPAGLFAEDRYFRSRRGDLYFVFVQPRDDRSAVATLAPFVASVRATLESSGLRELGVEWAFTGMPQYAVDDRDAVRADITLLSLVSLALVALVFVAGFSTVRLPLAAVLGLLLAVCWTLGLASVAPGYLTLLSAFFGSILFGLGVDHGIHVVARAEDLLRQGLAPAAAAAEAAASIASGLATGAVTTSALFLSLTACGFRGFAELGLIAGTGVLLCLLATVTVLPACIALAPARVVGRGGTSRLTATLLRLASPRLAAAMAAAAIVAGGVAYATGGPGFDGNYLDLQPKGSSAVALERQMVAESELSPQFAAFTAADPEDLRSLLISLLDSDDVGAVHSLADFGLYSPVGDLSDRFAAGDVAHLRSSDGRLAAYVYPDGDVWDPEVGSSFRDALRATGRSYTGIVALGDFMVQRSWRALRIAAALAALVLPVVVLLDFRRLAPAALALTPTALTAASFPLLLEACGIAFNPLNVLALPIVLGIAVDDGVHLTHRFVAERGDLAATLAGTGRSVVLTTATTLAAFGTLVLARHRGLSSFAAALAIGVGAALVFSLTVLPALLVAGRQRLLRADLVGREKEPRMMQALAVRLEMIQFKHTVFALPFAFLGAILAARGLPPLAAALWVLVAMVGARTAAMAFNRIVDARFDALNPRTADRALPAGLVSTREAWLLVVVSVAVFELACLRLNPLTLALSPLVLLLVLGYSLTKRFTAGSHLVLGAALSLSPLGGWVAVTGSLGGYPWWLSLGVLLWVAGFDIVYSCQDADFDRRFGLHSIPARLGRRRALRLAAALHAAALAAFAAVGFAVAIGPLYLAGVALAGAAMLYEHLLVRPDDLSMVHRSFFTMNGVVSVVLLVATAVSLGF
ncbi:MAG: UbiA-like polyprenyltransferase [Thermoanaerobaculia bacterium]|nr:UbiA-like polyprenyltransferase [Thermoanaerobaculia bacterium]